MRALNVLLSIVVSLLMGLLVLEGGLRLIGKGPTSSPLEFNADTGWAKKPGYTTTKKSGEFRAEFELNELGLRDDPMESAAKADGVFRILALGDSFTYGFSVQRDDLFVDQLENQLRAEGRNVEVINAGTEAWDTAQQAAWLEANGAAFAPDLVLVLPYENDLYWNSQTSYQTFDAALEKPRYSADGSKESRALTDNSAKPWHQSWAVTKWMRKADPGAAAHNFQPTGASRPVAKELAPVLADAPADLMGPIEQHSVGALRAIARAANDLGAGVLIAPIPAATLYEDGWKDIYNAGRGLNGLDWSGDRGVQLFLDYAAQAGLDAVDARDDLAAARAAGEPIYYAKDWHFNALGNGAFAGFLQNEIVARAEALGLPAANESTALPPLHTDAPEGLPFFVKLYLALFLALTLLYYGTYKDEPKWQPPIKVAVLLAVVFTVFMGVMKLPAVLPPALGMYVVPAFGVLVLGFVVYKLGNRVTTITELLSSFIRRGHWYLMPLVVVLLSIGSLLVVAASSPLVAPFIYTLF